MGILEFSLKQGWKDFLAEYLKKIAKSLPVQSRDQNCDEPIANIFHPPPIYTSANLKQVFRVVLISELSDQRRTGLSQNK